jgi:RNA polymerase sigma-70 factor (ECF subfamily)
MKAKTETDEQLMAKILAGSQEYFEPLVRRHANGLLNFIHKTIGDRHRSEELFQEVLLTFWKKRKQYDYYRRFKPWLYAIAANKVRAYLRSHAAVSFVSMDDEPPGLKFSGDTLVMAETASLVATAVHRLPAKQRIVVVLRLWSDMSYTEIADIVNRSESTVRANMHHALANMRTYLEPRMR